MLKLKVSDYLKTNYDDYYVQGDLEWRRVGAVDKVNNIVSLCNTLPRSSILEIGAGEGALPQSELEFSKV